jgi:hypothetical protein
MVIDHLSSDFCPEGWAGDFAGSRTGFVEDTDPPALLENFGKNQAANVFRGSTTFRDVHHANVVSARAALGTAAIR